jgi:hypothetical protein
MQMTATNEEEGWDLVEKETDEEEWEVVEANVEVFKAHVRLENAKPEKATHELEFADIITKHSAADKATAATGKSIRERLERLKEKHDQTKAKYI